MPTARTLVATDGADEVEPGADGKSLRVVWRRWALLNKKAGELIDPHITSEVVWRIDGATLTRDETLRSEEDITYTAGGLPYPAHSIATCSWRVQAAEPLAGREFGPLVTVNADWPVAFSACAPGDSALGRGARQPVLLHLIYESSHLRLPAKQDMHWRMTIKVQKVLGP